MAYNLFVEALRHALEAELSRDLAFGCVNMQSQGCHKDMDYLLFLKSNKVICTEIAALPLSAASSFEALRQTGYGCECRLMQATNGINTQKGLLFLTLFLWQAWVTSTPWAALLAHIQTFASNLRLDYINMAKSRSSRSKSAGLNDIRQLPLTGFQFLLDTVERYATYKWSDLELTLYLIANVDDTTTYHRGNTVGQNTSAADSCGKLEVSAGLRKLRYVQETAKSILSSDKADLLERAKQLNKFYLMHNLSSGGVADLFSLIKCLAELRPNWPNSGVWLN